MYDQNTPIQQFLDATAARQPTPGGGSVTALCGALSAAIGEMVLNYSIGKKELAAYDSEFRPVLQTLSKARKILVDHMVEDQNAYAALSAARKLPPGPDRDAQFAAALLKCIRTPEAIGATAVVVLNSCDHVISFVNFQLLSDLAVCADLAMATARCAVYNVRVNLTEVTNPTDRQRIESTMGQLLSQAAGLIQRIGPRIWARHGQEVVGENGEFPKSEFANRGFGGSTKLCAGTSTLQGMSWMATRAITRWTFRGWRIPRRHRDRRAIGPFSAFYSNVAMPTSAFIARPTGSLMMAVAPNAGGRFIFRWEKAERASGFLEHHEAAHFNSGRIPPIQISYPARTMCSLSGRKSSGRGWPSGPSIGV